MTEGEANFITWRFESSAKKLYIDYLRQVEDLREDGVIDDERFEYLRNRILDIGNGSVREFREAFDQYVSLIN